MRSPFLIFILLVICSTGTLNAQHIVDSSDVSQLDTGKYYTRYAFFDKHYVFCDQLAFDRPFSIDEEYKMTYKFIFANKRSIIPGTTINVSSDTALVKSHYSFMSAWIWDFDDSASFTGTIRIVSAKRRKIVVEENVRIVTEDGEAIHYTGVVTFRKRRKV